MDLASPGGRDRRVLNPPGGNTMRVRIPPRAPHLAGTCSIHLGSPELAIPDATIEPPGGGSVLWVEFPLEDSTAVVNAARRHGVLSMAMLQSPVVAVRGPRSSG